MEGEDIMFKVNNEKNGNYASEIYEEGFNITVQRFMSKDIQWFQRNILGDYFSNVLDDNYVDVVIPTGIKSLDDAIGGGFKPGLYVIGANPGMGKTSLMLHILVNLALNKKHSLFFSLDMSDVQSMLRLVANLSYRSDNLDSMTINDLSNYKVIVKDKKLDDRVNNLYRSYMTYLNQYIHIFAPHLDSSGKLDTNVCYVDSVEKAIQNTQKYIKDNNPIVVVDLLQSLQNKPVSTYRDENDGDFNLRTYDARIEMDKIVEKLKQYSSTYNVPIVVLTATNRASYTKSNNYSDNTDYDLGFSKESGNIEFRADVLIKITEGEGSSNFGGPSQKRLILNIAKSRNSVDHVSIPLDFITEYSFFREVTED